MNVKYYGDLTITKTNENEFTTLTEVTGGCEFAEGANPSLPALTKTGWCKFAEGANPSLPALTKTGWCEFAEGANPSLPALTKVEEHSLPDPDIARARLVEVAKHALATPEALDMGVWHRCDTTHCIAGWAVHLAGKDGYALENEVSDTGTAGMILLGAEAAKLFHVTTENGRKALEKVLLDAGEQIPA